VSTDDGTHVGDDHRELGGDTGDEFLEMLHLGRVAVHQGETAKWRVGLGNLGDGGEGLGPGALSTGFGDHAIFEFEQWLNRKDLTKECAGSADAPALTRCSSVSNIATTPTLLVSESRCSTNSSIEAPVWASSATSMQSRP